MLDAIEMERCDVYENMYAEDIGVDVFINIT
jgi:hypothetical protein